MSDRREWLDEKQEMTREWRDETIEGDPTPVSQAAHTAVEAAEVLDLIVKGETYQEADGRGVDDELLEELGDVVVAHFGTMSLLGVDAGDFDEEPPGRTVAYDTPLEQSAQLLRVASGLPTFLADADLSVDYELEVAAVWAMDVLEAHYNLIGLFDVELETVVGRALEKNGARDWADHQEEATG